MLLSRLSICNGLILSSLLRTISAAASLQTPACSLNCTLQVLQPACIADIRNCLCTNNSLQYELTLCVFESCSQADQIIASEILQTEICVGVPHDSRSAEIIRVEIILAAFTFPMIALRLISRIWVARRVWWDDWMIVICALFMIPNTAIPIYTAFIGFGVHIWDVPILNTTKLNLLYWIASLFYAFIQSTVKLSILFLYLRIFPTPTFRRVVQVSIAWMLCHMIAFGLVVVFQCLPVQAFWDLTLERTCMNDNAALKAGAFFSIFEDLVIMVLPVSELYRLNLDLKKRIALCAMFAMGSFACVTSMVRLKYVWNYTMTVDGTWNDVDIVIWSDIETYVAVICSCLICIRPLIIKVFPTLFPSTHESSASTKNMVTNAYRKTWGMKMGTKLRMSKMINMDSSNRKMIKLEDKEQGVNQSALTLIIQGNTEIERNVNNDTERNIQGVEMEEMGVSPSTSGRNMSMTGAAVSTKEIDLGGGHK